MLILKFLQSKFREITQLKVSKFWKFSTSIGITLTGFYINRDTIMDMYYNQKVPGLRRVRFRNKWLFLIYEYLFQNRTCVTFRADRWYPVANASIQYLMGTFEYSEAGEYQ